MSQYKIKINKLPKGEVEIEGEIEASLLSEARKKAIKKISEKVEIDGFRKGNVPEKVLLDKFGEDFIMEEAAEILLQEHYPKIVENLKIDTIGKPSVSITKLALGNPLEFKIKTTTLPEVKLPDYKKIAEKINSKETKIEEVTEKEVDDVLMQIRKNKAHFDWHEANKDKGHDPVRHGSAEGMPGGHTDHPNFDTEEHLPALDDEFAKQAGKFANLSEMKDKIKENIKKEKEFKEIEKRRAEVMDELVARTDLEVPEILIESETSKYVAQMKDDIEKAGGKFEDYLGHIKKTEEELRKEWRDPAEKKAKVQLIFNKIAETEKLEPNKEVLENEIKQILEHYPGSNEESARIYVSTILLNSEVLKLLEKKA